MPPFVKPPDFRVRYRFRSAAQGGRTTLPFQGFRCDFQYSNDDPKRDPVYYVWPEFEDLSGHVLAEGSPVLEEGTALMYIIQDPLRGLHSSRLCPGVRCHFLEGNRVVADLEVTEVLALAGG